MLPNSLRESFLRLNFLILLFIFELSFIFIKQWYVERRKKSENVISLGYGFYYFFIGIGFLIYMIRRHYFINMTLWKLFFFIESSDSYFLYILTISIMGFGGFIFCFSLEYKYSQFLKTRYFFTLFLIILGIIAFLMRNTVYFFPFLNFFSGTIALLPVFFNYYLIKNSLGEVRKKLILGTIGLGLSLTGLMGETDQAIKFLILSSFYYEPSLKIFELITIFGLALMLYSFYSFSLMLEVQWKDNLISLFLIDKKTGKEVYIKNFSTAIEERDKLLLAGMKGIISMVNELSGNNKTNLKIIDRENLKFILYYGKKIFSVLIVKRNLINIHYFLQNITEQFEINFSSIYESWFENNELFKPMDKIIEKLFPGMR